MSKKIKTLLWVIVFVVIMAGTYVVYNLLSKNYEDPALQTPSENSAQTESSAQNEEKISAPDFTVTDIQGNQVKLSDFYGKPIVLNFWASWCPPCKAELPDFEKVYNQTKGQVQFLMLNMTDGQRETAAKGSAFITDNGYTFPVFYDTQQQAASAYGITSIPTTLFINKEGYIVAGHEGQMSESMLKQGISMIN